MSEKITLWTRQDQRFLDVIKKEKVFYSKKEYIEEKHDTLSAYYLPLYDWFVEEAEKRVSRPPGAQYPIWCSISDAYMLRGAQGNVLIELSVDKERVLYFNSGKWDLVLNHTYIPKDDKDQEDFSKELKDLGIKNSFSFMGDYYQKFYPGLVKKIKDSWQRIFDVDLEHSDIFSIQANIWEIRPEDILLITEYEEENTAQSIMSLSDYYK